MNIRYSAVGRADWKQGDYRHAASLSRGSHSIEQLAGLIGAELESFVEDGWGPGQSFGAVSDAGRQVAFDFYPQGPEGPNLLVLFEDGKCSAKEVQGALAFFGIAREHVYWFAPEATDV